MREKLRQSVDVDLDHFVPRGDMVLVRRLPDPEETQGGLHIPATSRDEGRPKDPKDRVRRGVVVAAGDGDISFMVRCGSCGKGADLTLSVKRVPGREEISREFLTHCECGVKDWKAWDGLLSQRSTRPMYVAVGDMVLWERCTNNEVVLNGEEYTLLHAESQILAVLDEMDVAA